MGKGSRSRIQYAEKKEKREQERAIELQKEKSNKFTMRIIALLIAVIMGSGLIYYFGYYSNGKYLRNEVVASTTNFEVDNAMMTYYFNTEYASLQSSYGDYFSLFTGIDTSYSLKIQEYDDEDSWFIYLLSSAVTDLADTMALAEAALTIGLELDETDYVIIDRLLEQVSDFYLQDGINIDDIERCFELNMLAQKYTYYALDTMVYDDDAIEEFYEEYITDYQYVSYLTYTIDYDDTDETAFTYEEALAYADEFAAIDNEDDFLALAIELLYISYPDLTDEEYESAIEYFTIDSSTYSSSTAVSVWAFEEGREVGEVYTEDDESSSIDVYYLTQTPARDESLTANMIRINFSSSYETLEEAEAAAEEVLALYNEDPTEENFRSLVAYYSDDSSSLTQEGVYEDLAQGSGEENFDEWLYDESREYGDVQIIVTSDDVELIYYLGVGEEAWFADAYSDIVSMEYVSLLDIYIELYPMSYDLNSMYDIPA